MACEFFEDERLARCRAVAGILIPSHYERERYCRTNTFERCPTRRVYQIRRSPLSEEAYLALWLPPLPEVPVPTLDAVEGAQPTSFL